MPERTDVSVYDGIILQSKLKKWFKWPFLTCFKLIPGCLVSCCYCCYLHVNKQTQNVLVFSAAHSWDGPCFRKWNNAHAHRVWETKDYSCCVTDKRTGKQTDPVTCLSSHRVHRESWTFLTPFWSPIHKFIHLQRKNSDEFATQESNFPIWLVHFSANDPLLSKPLVLSCIVRELKLGLTANLPATNAS